MTVRITLALAAICTLPGAVTAQADMLSTLANRADTAIRANGYRATRWQHRGKLRQRGAETVRVTLAGTQPVRIVGMCDGGCDDLNLDLIDASGKSIDRDTGSDGFPIVAADEGGSYSVRVTMPECDDASCSYLIRAYAKR